MAAPADSIALSGTGEGGQDVVTYLGLETHVL